MKRLLLESWAVIVRLAGAPHGAHARCLLDLRSRVEILERPAAVKDSLTAEPASMGNASAALQQIQQQMQGEGRALAAAFDKALEPFKAAPAAPADELTAVLATELRSLADSLLLMRANVVAAAVTRSADLLEQIPQLKQELARVRLELEAAARIDDPEQRAVAEECSATEPAPAADRPLWRVMHEAWSATGAAASDATGYAAEIDAMATWLERRYLDRYPGAAELLRTEAQRAREGA